MVKKGTNKFINKRTLIITINCLIFVLDKYTVGDEDLQQQNMENIVPDINERSHNDEDTLSDEESDDSDSDYGDSDGAEAILGIDNRLAEEEHVRGGRGRGNAAPRGNSGPIRSRNNRGRPLRFANLYVNNLGLERGNANYRVEPGVSSAQNVSFPLGNPTAVVSSVGAFRDLSDSRSRTGLRGRAVLRGRAGFRGRAVRGRGPLGIGRAGSQNIGDRDNGGVPTGNDENATFSRHVVLRGRNSVRGRARSRNIRGRGDEGSIHGIHLAPVSNADLVEIRRQTTERAVSQNVVNEDESGVTISRDDVLRGPRNVINQAELRNVRVRGDEDGLPGIHLSAISGVSTGSATAISSTSVVSDGGNSTVTPPGLGNVRGGGDVRSLHGIIVAPVSDASQATGPSHAISSDTLGNGTGNINDLPGADNNSRDNLLAIRRGGSAYRRAVFEQRISAPVNRSPAATHRFTVEDSEDTVDNIGYGIRGTRQHLRMEENIQDRRRNTFAQEINDNQNLLSDIRHDSMETDLETIDLTSPVRRSDSLLDRVETSPLERNVSDVSQQPDFQPEQHLLDHNYAGNNNSFDITNSDNLSTRNNDNALREIVQPRSSTSQQSRYKTNLTILICISIYNCIITTTFLSLLGMTLLLHDLFVRSKTESTKNR